MGQMLKENYMRLLVLMLSLFLLTSCNPMPNDPPFSLACLENQEVAKFRLSHGYYGYSFTGNQCTDYHEVINPNTYTITCLSGKQTIYYRTSNGYIGVAISSRPCN